ncbi:hypothetical protein VTJ83DRAFT_4397 [Remersonia thermophila]|uniref:LOV domain-containing protein n=1 Tax=Remersonia thermophila TaxID=72144 RepID=A0ABR4DAK9_9PEZI
MAFATSDAAGSGVLRRASLGAGTGSSRRDSVSKVDSDYSSTSPQRSERHGGNSLMTALSPPPATKPARPKHKTLFRLRSDSGLALHSNPSAFRQYTAYNNDGSPQTTRPHRRRTPSLDVTSSIEDYAIGYGPEKDPPDLPSDGTVPLDFFDPAVIRLAFSDPSTVRRFRAFAEVRDGGSDMDFLQHVEEYSRALERVVSSMKTISSRFTGTTATSPLSLPRDVECALRTDTKYCTRTALPALDKLYQEAKTTAQERLSHNLYPEYVKHKLSEWLKDALSSRALGADTPAPFRGLGEAFCLTDPLQPDNPIVFASDGLIETCGYSRDETVGQNARLFQGVATDPGTVCRLSQAVSSGRESTELILNYRPDGTPYWNLLFVCPLIENGALRYFFGAQVHISYHMGSECKDVLAILNYGSPPDNLDAVQPSMSRSATVSSRRGSDDNGECLSMKDERRGSKQPSRRQRFMRRFRRRSPSPKAQPPSRASTASLSASDDALGPLRSPSAFATPASSLRGFDYRAHDTFYSPPQPVDEESTIYSCFLLMRYEPCDCPAPASSAPSFSQPASPRARSPDSTASQPHHLHVHHPHHAQQTHHLQPPADRGRKPGRERRRLTRAPRSAAGSAAKSSKPKDACSPAADPPSCAGISLPIAFGSPHALRLLGLGAHEAEAVAGRDVFGVLTSRFGAGAPGGGEGAAAVRAALARGESVVTDMLVPAPSAAPSRSVSWPGPMSGLAQGWKGGSSAASAAAAAASGKTVGLGGAGENPAMGSSGGLDGAGSGSSYGSSVSNLSAITGDGNGNGNGNGAASAGSTSESRPWLSDTLESGTELLNQVLFSQAPAAASDKGCWRRVVSCWVPLKDKDGKVGWVALALMPGKEA